MITIKDYRFRARDLPFLALGKIGKALLGGKTADHLIRPVIVEKDGFRWIWRPKSDDGIAFSNTHEPFLLTYMKASREDVFLDVGAHVGRYAIRMAKLCREVIAIEPNPSNREGLLANIKLNRITNIRVLPYAAWSEEATINLVLRGGQSKVSEKGMPVKAIPIDLINFSGRVGLIKIDVEGAEVKVLQGAKKTMKNHRPTLLVEVHTGHFGEGLLSDIENILAEFGYSYDVIGTGGGGKYLLAKPERDG